MDFPRAVLLRTIVLVTAAFAPMPSVAEAQEIYAPDYLSQSVSVQHAITNAPVATIPVVAPTGPYCPAGGNPQMAAFSLDRKHAFISIDECDQIAVIDTETRTIVKFIPGNPGEGETRIWRRPQGDLLYVNTCSYPTVTVIDATLQDVVATIDLPGGGGTTPLAFSPDGRRAYAGSNGVWCGGPSGIHLLDLDTNSVIGFIPTPQDVFGLAVSPDGTVALAAGMDQVMVVDLTNTMVVGSVMCGAAACTYGANVYGGWEWWAPPYGIAYNAAGNRAYVVDTGNNRLITINTSTPLAPQQLASTQIVTSKHAWELKILGSRLWVVLAAVPSEIVGFDIQGDIPIRLPGGGASLSAFEFDEPRAGFPKSLRALAADNPGTLLADKAIAAELRLRNAFHFLTRPTPDNSYAARELVATADLLQQAVGLLPAKDQLVLDNNSVVAGITRDLAREAIAKAKTASPGDTRILQAEQLLAAGDGASAIQSYKDAAVAYMEAAEKTERVIIQTLTSTSDRWWVCHRPGSRRSAPPIVVGGYRTALSHQWHGDLIAPYDIQGVRQPTPVCQ